MPTIGLTNAKGSKGSVLERAGTSMWPECILLHMTGVDQDLCFPSQPAGL